MRPVGRELTNDELAEEMRTAHTLTPVVVVDGDGTEHTITRVDIGGDRIELVIEAAPYAEEDDDVEEMRAILREVAESKSQAAAVKKARAYIAELDAATQSYEEAQCAAQERVGAA